MEANSLIQRLTEGAEARLTQLSRAQRKDIDRPHGAWKKGEIWNLLESERLYGLRWRGH